MSKTYAILSWEPTPEQWAAVPESPETCRRSLAGDEVVLKWEGPTPAPLIGAPQYTHAEALAIMATSAWSAPPEEEPPP